VFRSWMNARAIEYRRIYELFERYLPARNSSK